MRVGETMRLAFDRRGKEGTSFVVPDERLLGHHKPRTGADHDVRRMAEAALDAPVGAASIDRQARRHRDVTILVDDATRGTPTARLLPPLLERLRRAGVHDDRVTILVACGTHRHMGRHELREKLGDVVDQIRVVQHDNKSPTMLSDRGRTEDGMPVIINPLVAIDRLCIGIGTVAVHGIMGYSGGAKIASIGAAGPATEAWTHWQAATRFQVSDLLGIPANPLRRNIDEAGRLAGLDAVLNVATDGAGNVQQVAYGDPIAVHRRLIPTVQEHHLVRLPGRADIAIIETAPADRDYWQSVKGLYVAELVLRDGGAAILVAGNPEGIADDHPNVERLAGLPYSEIVRRVDEHEEKDVIGAAIAAFTARTRRHMTVHMVTSGISDDKVRGLGMEPADSVQQALDEVTSALGTHLRTVVLEKGGHLLPVVDGINHERVRPPAYAGTIGH